MATIFRSGVIGATLWALLGVAPGVVCAQSTVAHVVWLVGDWEHRSRNSGMYEYLRSKLTEVFQHDGCINDGADTLEVHQFYYNPLAEIVTAGTQGAPEAMGFCEALRATLPPPGGPIFTLTVVGLGTGVTFAKNALLEFGDAGEPCELADIDSGRLRINYVWIDQPTGYNDLPSILHPHARWDPYRAYATRSTEMVTSEESLRVFGAQLCRTDGVSGELGCGYEWRHESSVAGYNPFKGFAPPAVGAVFATSGRAAIRRDVLFEVNASWYSQFGNIALAPSCRCPADAAYYNTRHMIICWCDGAIEWVGGKAVCRQSQLPVEWIYDPSYLWGGLCWSDPACRQFLLDNFWMPDDPPTTMAQCGDGNSGLGEECDDGNNSSNDGCSADCVKEICGDGTVQKGIGEECDDRNATNGDGCSAGCKVERCGDGVQQRALGEDCDDGNTTDGDGCSALCKVEKCGDGIVQEDLGESCDGSNFSDDCPKRIFAGCLQGWLRLARCAADCSCVYEGDVNQEPDTQSCDATVFDE